MAEIFYSGLQSRLGELTKKQNQPKSTSVLNNWITHAETRLGSEFGGGRLGWLIASSIAVAAVQRAVDEDGRQLFLLKGGSYLQHRLNAPSRSTKDIDGLVRGDIDEFLQVLDGVLTKPWGPFELRRGSIETIHVPTRILQPRRFDIFLELRGVTWRRLQFEISADEAGIGEEYELIRPLPLGAFGLEEPDMLAGITLRHQIAQKLHAVSDPHDPPASVNDRARDLVDLILLQQLAADTGQPMNREIATSARAVFQARDQDAAILGLQPRRWPPTVISHPHWSGSYVRSANEVGIDLTMEAAVARLNSWILELDNL